MQLVSCVFPFALETGQSKWVALNRPDFTTVSTDLW